MTEVLPLVGKNKEDLLVEVAARINRCQYREETSKEFESLLKEKNLVVVYGASDDLMEFVGAMYEEEGAYGGLTVYLNKDGILRNECNEGEDCPYYAAHVASQIFIAIEAVWCEGEYSWTYKTDIPHESFDIMEDEDYYCRGIVFSLDDLPD